MRTRIRISLLVLLGVTVANGSAHAQPVFTTHHSLEARIAEADAVVRGRISEIKRIEVVPPGGRDDKGILQPDGIYDRDVIVTVEEVLKGKVKDKLDDLRVVPAFYYGEYHDAWMTARTSLLVFLGPQPEAGQRRGWQVLRLGQRAPGDNTSEPVYSSNLTILKNSKDILDRAQTYASLSTKKLPSHAFRLPPILAQGSQYSSILIPVDAALEERARRMITSPEDFIPNGAMLSDLERRQLRYAGVTSLRYFKSDANAALLRTVVAEPWEEVMPDFQRPFSIQSKAYEILLTWDMDAPQPKWTSGLTVLELAGSPLNDSAMKRVAKLTNLKALDIQGTQVTAKGLRELAGLKKLTRLGINEAHVTDDCLRSLREVGLLHALSLTYVGGDKRPELPDDVVGLYLGRTPITDAGLKELTGLRNVTFLWLNETRINGAGFKDLAGMNRLTHVGLEQTPVDDVGLKHIASLQSLTSLGLKGTKITDAGLKELTRLPQLKVLDLEGTAVTAAGVRDLLSMKSLNVLNLTGSQVTNETLRVLREAGKLHILSNDTTLRNKRPTSDAELTFFGLGGTHVTDDGLKELAGLANLRTLGVGGAKISGAGFKHLSGLGGLTEIFAHKPGFTEAGLREIAALKSLRTLHMYGKDITDERVRALCQTGTLHVLYEASSRTDFPPATFPPRAKLDGLVRSLDIGGWRSTEGSVVTDAVLKDIARLKNLVKLDLTHTAVTGLGVKDLAELEHLAILNLGGFQVTDAGLKDLPRLKKLAMLGLHDTKVTHVGARQLAELKNVTALKLTGKNVTDAWLVELARHENLTNLRLYWTSVTPAGLTEFRKARPNCVIEGTT